MTTDALHTAFAALADAEESLRALEEGCCDPVRVPCIATLGTTLAETRRCLEHMTADPTLAEVVVTALGDVGGRLGTLQVTCCTPDRVPLYARLLEDLTKVQLDAAAARRGH